MIAGKEIVGEEEGQPGEEEVTRAEAGRTGEGKEGIPEPGEGKDAAGPETGSAAA